MLLIHRQRYYRSRFPFVSEHRSQSLQLRDSPYSRIINITDFKKRPMTEPSKLLNPWVLHHQKLGLELKCPLCLNLLNRPMLLPCNHIFCDLCVPGSTQFGSDCPVCKQQFVARDVRPAPYIESLVTIYKSLDATFSATLFQPLTADCGRVSQQFPVQGDHELKESSETPHEGNSSNGLCTFLPGTSKRIRASLDHPVAEGNALTGKSDKCTLQFVRKSEKLKICDVDGMVFHGKNEMTTARNLGSARTAEYKDPGLDVIEFSHMLHPSPVSVPSLFDKHVDDERSDQGSGNDCAERHPDKSLVEMNSDNPGAGMKERTFAEAGEYHAKDVKRQKKLNCGLLDMDVTNNSCSQPKFLNFGSAATSELMSKAGELPRENTSMVLDACEASRSICAFCQSSSVTDRSGPMLHYVNGREVVGDGVTNSNAIHAHKICIEWTPQAYFVGETVKNLKAEVARAAKLKCTSCGLRGAALGCFVKSCRRSYHVPCAVEVLGCRWNFDDFLMLCPNHSSVKFPSENSKFGKCTIEKQHFVPTKIESRTPKQSNLWRATPDGAKEWVFCGSALCAEDKHLLIKFASICGATVTKFWRPNVTHVIAATDEKGACSRTLKVLKAILHGTWILKTEWIKACMETMHPVDEEPYEVSLDNHGCCGGPRAGRLRALENVPKLFDGLNFYFIGDFIPAYREDLLDLVITAGGGVVESKQQLASLPHAATLVVYNNDPMQVAQGCMFEEDGSSSSSSSALQRLEAATKALSDELGSLPQVIAHTWLLESIAASKLQPFGK